MSGINAQVRKIAALASNGEFTRAELINRARGRFPRQPADVLSALIEEAIAAGILHETHSGILRAAPRTPALRAEIENAPVTDSKKSMGRRALRAVAIDLESVVRTTDREPYTERRIFQIGAVRCGADSEWTEGAERFTRWVELPADGDWQIMSERMRSRHAASAVPASRALADLLAYLEDADVLVAYNGTDADFPMIAEALGIEGLPELPGTLVDGYYLVLALWPDAPSHRLASLAAHLDIETSGLSWHDACDDAELLARLLDAGARVLAAWPATLIDLVASVCHDSAGWRLLREMAGAGDRSPLGTERTYGHGELAESVSGLLAGHPVRRGVRNVQGAGELDIPAGLRGQNEQVDPARLAAVAHGEHARRRPAQDAMAAALQNWVASGVPGMVEAPTGTGKSYALLAVVLDWLAGDPARNVIITTFTKQLQAQLAEDLARLATALPGLPELSDVVKGKANRLSLRALLAALADATSLDPGGRVRPGTSGRFLPRLKFRELLIYLLLRLRAATDPVTAWAAHSVDPVDVPPFFSDYAGPALLAWLATLSQADAGDYAPDPDREITLHTDSVAEALAGRGLILANHALLLAHLDQLEALDADTLLVIDEAHELENAATAALTTVLDYRAIEDLHAELAAWTREAAPGSDRDAVSQRVADLGKLLDHEHLPKIASQAFDACAVAAPIGARTVTLASPYGGVSGLGRVRTLASTLIRFAGISEAVVGALSAYRAGRSGVLDFYAHERINTLLNRTAAARAATDALIKDMDQVLGSVQSKTALPNAKTPDNTAEQASEAVDEEEPEDHDPAPLQDEDHQLEFSTGQGTLPPGTPNRVVHAEELDLLRAGLRRYRFRLATSPIELHEDPNWQRFLMLFSRVYYVSATLRVAGEWNYVRSRLGLPETVQTLHLDSPFDLANQAKLVCFADFPSWVEQTDCSVRTVAHQLARYASELIHPAAGTDSADGRGGYNGGALVLTTARSTSGGIAENLAMELRRSDNQTPVIPALVRGNRQALAEFTDLEHGGGIVVATKGLWQGVDVADPDRLRLVWINKLPFAPFAEPVVAARRSAVAVRAESLGTDDPERVAAESYYLPMAALQLRQAVGRLIRSERHRGVVVISDRKLAGITALRRTYRRIFLGSLDPGLLESDPRTGEPGGGNVVPMTDGWRRIWAFFAQQGLLDGDRASTLSTPEALEAHTVLPQTRGIRALALSADETQRLALCGQLPDEVVRRAAEIGGLLRLVDGPVELKPAQESVLRAVAEGRDVLGLLPTGFGKSYCFQLPALVLPGVTIVISPLVALMQDQALELNRSIGGAVRALVGPMRESNSRAGRTEVGEQLRGRVDHGIKLVYVSPERFCQTRFRELVRAAVRDGVVSRIAIDEAHTAVQWGDDFRPAFRRVERFLAELRSAYGLRVTALTATANRTVEAGLRERVFGVPANASTDGRAGVPDSGLVTVRENPIRPELAIFRRAMEAAGPTRVAGLLEEVVRRLQDHAIFYCLTVKEVVAVHAHLRDHIGDGNVLVRRFHGRLTEAEKAAVMTEFREALRREEEGFVPLLVVATSAFGLGVDRPDVRTVFCVSPPTDLAALYQQIGRAGRDAASGGASPATVNAGLVLATNRGLRTVRFMTSRNVPAALLRRMGAAVIKAPSGVLNAAEAADHLIGEDLAARRIDAATARASRTHEEYADALVRVFAALADLGAVEDLGDFPPFVTVEPGEQVNIDTDADELEEKAIAAILALPGRHGPMRRSALSVVALHRHLSHEVAGYESTAQHPAATWELLADLHDRGRLDVSAAPSRRFVTGMTVLSRDLPDGFHVALSGRAVRAAAELDRLVDFFNDTSTCANRKLADYFGIAELPEGCCSGPANRCSACWDHRLDIPHGEPRPPVAMALSTSLRNPNGGRADTASQARLLDRQIRALLWQVYRGLTADHLRLALRGEDSWFHAGQRRRIPLPRTVTASRYFGAAPSVTKTRIEASLARLEDDGLVVLHGARWRDVENVRREAGRRAKESR